MFHSDKFTMLDCYTYKDVNIGICALGRTKSELGEKHQILYQDSFRKVQ